MAEERAWYPCHSAYFTRSSRIAAKPDLEAQPEAFPPIRYEPRLDDRFRACGLVDQGGQFRESEAFGSPLDAQPATVASEPDGATQEVQGFPTPEGHADHFRIGRRENRFSQPVALERNRPAVGPRYRDKRLALRDGQP